MTAQQSDNATLSLDEELRNIFTSGVFIEFKPRRFYGEVHEEKVGVVLATKNSGFNNFALNKGDFDKLLEAKRSGRIDQAFVVMARARTYCGHHDAERLSAEGNLQLREGKFGPFYVLPPDPDDEPF